LRATAGRDDRSPYGRRHSRAYETGRSYSSYRFPGDRRRGKNGGCYEMTRNFCRYSAGGMLYQDLNAVVNVLMFE